MTLDNLIYICGIVAAAGGAIGIINKYIVKPIQEILKAVERIDKLDCNQKILMKSTASLMEHIVTGNHIEKLKEDYEKLIENCIDN